MAHAATARAAPANAALASPETLACLRADSRAAASAALAFAAADADTLAADAENPSTKSWAPELSVSAAPRASPASSCAPARCSVKTAACAPASGEALKPSALVKAASAPFSFARRWLRLARALEMSSRSSSSGMRASAVSFFLFFRRVKREKTT